jgi:nitrate/nitrite-specific signal transduction histidine kinase
MADNREHGGYVLKVREDTTRALVALRSDNERLRTQLATVDSDRSRLRTEKLNLQDQLMSTREQLGRRMDEHSELIRRLTEIERENERVAGEFIDIETQNANLASLYVASYQLHGTLDRDQVLAAIKEIIINLIGSEDFAIFERVAGEDRLELIGWFDAPPERLRVIRLGEGIIGQVAATGQPVVDQHGRCGMVACIPLAVDNQVVGVIALFRLLPQKTNALERLDHELIDLLASQAGVALYCSRLHALENRDGRGVR